MPYRRPEDDLAKAKKQYYAKHRDMDPQSGVSKVLEAIGLDEPYRNDSGSYDYRRQAWDESQAAGNPDVGWLLPELRDEDIAAAAPVLEGIAGQFGPTAMGFFPSVQEDPKFHPFPRSMMGTREREGEAAPGALAHALDQWNWSPWTTEDILSFIGPDAPETVRRDIDAWKGGSSAIDRAIGDTADATQNPWVDPVEIGSAALYLGVPGLLMKSGKAVAKGSKKAVGAGRMVVQAAKKLKGGKKPAEPPMPYRDPKRYPDPYAPHRDPGPGNPIDPLNPRIPNEPPAPYAAGRSQPWRTPNLTLRETLANAVADAERKAMAARAGRAGFAAPAAVTGTGVAAGAIYGNQKLDEKRRRKIRGE